MNKLPEIQIQKICLYKLKKSNRYSKGNNKSIDYLIYKIYDN